MALQYSSRRRKRSIQLTSNDLALTQDLVNTILTNKSLTNTQAALLLALQQLFNSTSNTYLAAAGLPATATSPASAVSFIAPQPHGPSTTHTSNTGPPWWAILLICLPTVLLIVLLLVLILLICYIKPRYLGFRSRIPSIVPVTTKTGPRYISKVESDDSIAEPTKIQILESNESIIGGVSPHVTSNRLDSLKLNLEANNRPYEQHKDAVRDSKAESSGSDTLKDQKEIEAGDMKLERTSMEASNVHEMLLPELEAGFVEPQQRSATIETAKKQLADRKTLPYVESTMSRYLHEDLDEFDTYARFTRFLQITGLDDSSRLGFLRSAVPLPRATRSVDQAGHLTEAQGNVNSQKTINK